MGTIFLFAFLLAEIIFRIFVEIRELRLYGKKIPFSFLRAIPLVNDLIPYSENIIEEPIQSAFREAHEAAHKHMHHYLLRNLMKLCFYSLMVLLIIIMLGEWRISLWEIVLWFHFALFIFRLLYHKLCWSQEEEADKAAVSVVSKSETRRELERLQKTERPTSLLFAFLYREHPPAKYRRLRHI